MTLLMICISTPDRILFQSGLKPLGAAPRSTQAVRFAPQWPLRNSVSDFGPAHLHVSPLPETPGSCVASRSALQLGLSAGQHIALEVGRNGQRR